MRGLIGRLLRPGRNRAGKGKAARPGPRRRSAPRWVRRGGLMLALGLLTAAYLGGIAQLTRSGWIGARIDAAGDWIAAAVADAGFRVRSVRVHGASRTEAAGLREAIAVPLGTPILELDLAALQRRVERLPWVRVATVERSLPERLVVRLQEREPLALWQHEGEVALIDNTGIVIRGAPLAPFQDLPLLAGAGVPAAAPALLRMVVEDSGLAARITAGSYVEERRWNLLVDDRVWVKLPQERTREAWLRLATEEREHGILQRDILAVDIRNEEQWVFRLPPGVRTRMAIKGGG